MIYKLIAVKGNINEISLRERVCKQWENLRSDLFWIRFTLDQKDHLELQKKNNRLGPRKISKKINWTLLEHWRRGEIPDKIDKSLKNLFVLWSKFWNWSRIWNIHKFYSASILNQTLRTKNRETMRCVKKFEWKCQIKSNSSENF